jgi:hypothetical protein
VTLSLRPSLSLDAIVAASSRTDVGVGAAEAKRADAGHRGAELFRPGCQTLGNTKRLLVEGDVGIWPFEMETRRDLAMLESEDRFDESRDPSRGLQVADVGLHRTDAHRRKPGLATRQNASESIELDGVAQTRARAMSLHVTDARRRDSGRSKGPLDHGALRQAVGRGQPVGATVLIDCDSADHRRDSIIVRDGRGKRLENDDAGALAANVAVRPGVEGLASSVRRHRLQFGEAHGDRGSENDVHASRESESRFAAPEALASEMHGDERGRAGGVDGEARSAKVEEVGNPVGDHARGPAGIGVAVPHVIDVIRLRSA